MPTQTINLNNSEPAAPVGGLNVEWQADAPSLDPTIARNVSAYLPKMVGDSGAGGVMGLVPAPAAGDAAAGKVLKADGTWYVPPATPIPSGPANQVLASPNGASGLAALRALVSADLPLASALAPGAVKPDNSSITISAGVLSAAGASLPSGAANEVLASPNGSSGLATLRALVPADLPVATTSALGAVRPDGSSITISAGIISAAPGSGGGSIPNGIFLFPGILGSSPAYPTLANTGLLTAFNQLSTFSAINAAVGILLADSANTGSDHIEGVASAYPSIPFTLTAVVNSFRGPSSDSANPFVGVAILNSLTGKLMRFGIRWSGSSTYIAQWNVGLWNSSTSWDADLLMTTFNGNLLGIRVQDTGTTLNISFSIDGYLWTLAYSVSKSSSWLGSSGFNYLAAVLDPVGQVLSQTFLGWQVTYP
jgi:hypothetical protein